MININQPAGQKDEKIQQHVVSLKKKRKKNTETKHLLPIYFSNISTAYRQLQYENIPIWM